MCFILLIFLGVVLFPEATLPLRVVQPNFIAAVEKALRQVDAPYTIGVVGGRLMSLIFCSLSVEFVSLFDF